MIFRPDIKPPMWGPLEAVQYAVRVNAERLGIDFDDIHRYCPLWEQGGNLTHPLGSNTAQIAATGGSWNGSGFSLGASGALVVADSTGRYRQELTIIINHSLTEFIEPTRNPLIAIYTTTSNQVVYLEYFSSTQLHMVWNDYLVNYVGDSYESYWNHKYTEKNKKHQLALQLGDTAHRCYQDGILIGSKSTGIASLTNAPDTTIMIGFGFRPWVFYGGQDIDQVLVVSNLTAEHVGEFNVTPYALLMPVSRPVYFDLGAGGGTTGAFTNPSVFAAPTVSAGTLSGASVSSGTFVASASSVQPVVQAGNLAAVQAGSFASPEQSLQPTVVAGTLSGQQAGIFAAPSQSVQPSITAGALTGQQSATFNAPSLTAQPSIQAGTLVGVSVGNFTGPSLFVEPSVSAGSLLGLSAGSFTSPGASTQPTVAAGSLASAKNGAFVAPSVSTQPSAQAGALLGSQSGNFLGPSLVVSSSVTAATLQSLGSGLFSAPQVATRPVVATGSLIGASVGAAQAPSLSTAPVISAGVLVGNQSGNFLGPSLSLRPDVEAGTLAGVATSSGVFVSPQLSLHALVLAGALVGDTVTILPEEFNANSLITTEFVAVSRLELGRIQNNG